MRTLTLAFLLFSPLLSHAVPIPRPCNNMRCTPVMREIEQQFDAASGFTLGELPVLASGECYHDGYHYNPEIKQYGYVLLDNVNGVPYQGGTFSFFEKENSYAKFTVEEARARLPGLVHPDHVVELNSDHAYTDMNKVNPETPWRYWLKQDENNIYLTGQWGHASRMLCRYTKHK